MTRFSTLEGQQCIYMVPPNITGMMCGIRYAAQDRTGAITLTYEDGTEETRACERDISDFENIFAIVGYVQDGRIEQ